MKCNNKLVLGITGEIGSGKTTLSHFFEKRGFFLIDADRIGHEILCNENIITKLKKKFGQSILTQNAKIDRQKLADIVFANLDNLHELNAILHPAIIHEIQDRIVNTTHKKILVDAALLYQTHLDQYCDKVIIVTADKNIRIQRLIERGLAVDDAIARIKAQHIPHCSAAIYISNNNDITELNHEAEKLYQRLMK